MSTEEIINPTKALMEEEKCQRQDSQYQHAVKYNDVLFKVYLPLKIHFRKWFSIFESRGSLMDPPENPYI